MWVGITDPSWVGPDNPGLWEPGQPPLGLPPWGAWPQADPSYPVWDWIKLQTGAGYWWEAASEYWVTDPLREQMCGHFDRWDCIDDCLRRASLMAGPLAAGSWTGILVPKKLLRKLGIVTKVGFGKGKPYTDVGSLITYLGGPSFFRAMGEVFSYLNIPIGGWEAGTWGQCLGRCWFDLPDWLNPWMWAQE